MQSPLTETWYELSSEGNLPRYSDFNPMSLGECIPDILVLRVLSNPRDYRYSLIGGNVRPIMNENRRGQLMSTVEGQGPGSNIWSHLSHTVQSREPRTFSSPYIGPFKTIDSVKNHATPWADDDGNLTRLIIHICRKALLEALKMEKSSPRAISARLIFDQ